MKQPLLFLVIAVLGIAGCPPTLTGSPCQYDCNCPSDQRCEASDAGGACVTGTNTMSCGPGSPDAGIYGKVTLNGGATKPAGTQAWVLIWKNGFPSPGQPADFVVPTEAGGGFAFDGAVAGMSYGLAAQYDLDQDKLQTSTASDRIAFALTTSQLGDRVVIDVPTYTCVVFASHSASDLTPRLFEAFIDLPDVTSGQELQGLDGGSAEITGTTLGTVSLTYTPNAALFQTPRWAYQPSAPLAPADAAYSFKISAPFYNQVVCSVTRSPGVSPPNSVSVSATSGSGGPNTWDTSVEDTVSWATPSTETMLLPLIGLLGSGLFPKVYALTTAPIGATSLNFPGATMKNALCTNQGGGSLECTSEVTLIKQTGTATALALEGASLDQTFQVTNGN